MDLVELEWGGSDWIGLAQDRYRWSPLVSAVMKFRVVQNYGKLSSGYTNSGPSSSVQQHRVR
jgi:hypothetical protein